MRSFAVSPVRLCLASLTLAIAYTLLPAVAQEDQSTDREEAYPKVGNCVRTTRIDRTRILDDMTILLEMRGEPDRLMHLKHRCPQLGFHDYFTYEPTLGQLCAEIDHIVTRAGFHCEISHFSLYKAESDAQNPK